MNITPKYEGGKLTFCSMGWDHQQKTGVLLCETNDVERETTKLKELAADNVLEGHIVFLVECDGEKSDILDAERGMVVVR